MVIKKRFLHDAGFFKLNGFWHFQSSDSEIKLKFDERGRVTVYSFFDEQMHEIGKAHTIADIFKLLIERKQC